MLKLINKLALRSLIRILAFAAAYSLSVFHEVNVTALRDGKVEIWAYSAIFAAIGLACDLAFNFGRTSWRYASIHDVLVAIRGTTITVLAFIIGMFIFNRASALPRSTPILLWLLDIGALTGFLVLRRAIHDQALIAAFAPFLMGSHTKGRSPILMLGDPDSADAFLRDISRDPRNPYRPMGLITAASNNLGHELRGVPVLASLASAGPALERFALNTNSGSILFLDQTIVPADLDADVLGLLRSKRIRLLRRVNSIEVRDGAPQATYREVNLEELLSRPPIQIDLEHIRQLVSGRRILVTGAGGSIGSEICRQVSGLGCAHLGMLDHSEFALFNIDMEIGDKFTTLSKTAIICDVRDAARVSSWVRSEGPDIVFHAAALKHVPLMESHPCESVLTNVVGTWNVAEAARLQGVADMVFISTDKAVDPSNVMGATKRLAESTVRVNRAAGSNTRFSVVRFGNVLGSAGSVVPTFMAQIERGGPITVTHAEIERYFMTIPEAVQLVLHATAISATRKEKQSGVFVLDMGKPVKIMELALRLIELSGKTPGRDIEIQVTGLRPGEKLTEALVDSTEEARLCDPGFFEISDRFSGARIDRIAVQELERVARTGDSDNTRSVIFEWLDRVRGSADDIVVKIPELRLQGRNLS